MNWRQTIVAGLAALVLAESTVAVTTMHGIAHVNEQHSAAGPSRQPRPDNASDSAGRVAAVLLATSPGVNAVTFSPDGKLLASAYANGTVRLWNPATGQLHGPVLRSTDSSASADAVAFSPDGTLLAGAYTDGTVRLWNPATGQIASSPLQIGSDQVSGVAFSPDGRLLASACGDAVRIWGRAAEPGSQDDVSWLAILAFAIAIAVSALAVIITARQVRQLKKLHE
jgi:WD40 repeat protein